MAAGIALLAGRIATAALFGAGFGGAAGPKSAARPDFVCPPCGHDCLKTVFHRPGSCGVCGMKLVLLSSVMNAAAMSHATGPGRKVAILLFDGVQIIDYAGPWEVFGGAGYEVFTVAKRREPLTTVYGMNVTPHHTLQGHPRANVVVVPGGQVFATQGDPDVKRWLEEQTKQAQVVMAVCNGAFILAKAGLLRGLKATTTRPLLDGLAKAAPGITVVRDVRFVDNGRIVTSGGLSAGMDAALHVVSRLSGRENAEQVARRLEYEWRRNDPHR